LLIETIHTSGL